jgi:hypothetical protein
VQFDIEGGQIVTAGITNEDVDGLELANAKGKEGKLMGLSCHPSARVFLRSSAR